MKIILLQNVKKIGKQGEIKDVADGYAMNFLIPNKLAVSATQDQLKKVETQKKRQQKQIVQKKSELEKILKKIKDQTIKVSAKASDKGKLFAAINAGEIIKVLQKKLNVDLEKHAVKINGLIKETGVHDLDLNIDGKQVKIKLSVQGEK